MKIYFHILLFGSVVLFGCLKPRQYPVEPHIEFDSFTAMGDSGLLVIEFTDGDGNIGLAAEDTTGSFAPGNRYHHNLFVEYFEKENGAWVVGKDLLGEDIVFKYRIPVITPRGKNKALKGKINVTIEPSYYNPVSPHSDSIKYRITLVDRDFNESNIVESSEIYR